MNKKLSLSLKIILVISLLAGIFFVRFGMLQKSQYFNGLDGYFYGLQAKSFAQTGSFENPDLETGYFCCGILSFIFQNPLIGVKVWASLAFALFCLSIFSLIYSLVKNHKFFYGLSSMLITAGTFFSTAYSINYINNLTGLIFLVFFVQIFISVFNQPSSKKRLILRIVLLIILFVFCYLSHKVSFIYALVFSVLFICSKLAKYLKNKKVLILSIILMILFVCASIFVLITQWARFSGTFSYPSLPVFHKEFIYAFGDLGFYCALEMSIIFLAAWFLFFLDLIISKKIKLSSFLLMVLFFPFWDLGTDMGLRMMMNGTILGIPLIFYIISNLIDEKKTVFIKSGLLALSGIGFISLIFSPSVYNPKNDPPYGYYKEVVSKINLPDDSLLIAHLGLNHVYTYYNNLRDCMNWLPDYEISDDKVWRLAFGIDYDYLKSFFNDISDENLSKWLLPVDSNYVLIIEHLWNLYLSREDSEIAETYKNWFNPYEIRPAYIRDN